MPEPSWYAPETLEEALQLRAHLGDDAMVVAGGTFTGILVGQGLVAPSAFIHLARVPELAGLSAEGGDLHVGATVTHRELERSQLLAAGWAALAATFAQVASPRIRNQATAGGVLCDADYASDPPAMLAALEAEVRLRGPAGERRLPVLDFITGHYQTQLAADELLLEILVPPIGGRAVYLKFRSRSSEDRPCVGVAAAADLDAAGRCSRLRVVVGAVSDRPQLLPKACALAAGRELTGELAAEIANEYSEEVPALSDVRGSSGYRKRVMAVCVRRALEALAA